MRGIRCRPYLVSLSFFLSFVHLWSFSHASFLLVNSQAHLTFVIHYSVLERLSFCLEGIFLSKSITSLCFHSIFITKMYYVRICCSN
jgi:hypothetical protein